MVLLGPSGVIRRLILFKKSPLASGQFRIGFRNRCLHQARQFQSSCKAQTHPRSSSTHSGSHGGQQLVVVRNRTAFRWEEVFPERCTRQEHAEGQFGSAISGPMPLLPWCSCFKPPTCRIQLPNPASSAFGPPLLPPV